MMESTSLAECAAPATSVQAQDIAAVFEAHPSPLALLRRAALRWPSREALVCLAHPEDQTGRSIGYAELLERVEAAIAALRRAGVGNGDAVAILLPTIPDAAVALIAATSVGVAFPMNLLLSSEALAAQLDLARTRVVVTMGPHPVLDVHARVMAAVERVPSVTSTIEMPAGPQSHAGLAWSDLAARSAVGEAIDRAERSGEVAAYFHTGGTSGAPKLAQLTARNLAAGALMSAAALGWRDGERILSGMPLFHVGGAIDVLLSAFAAGATVIFPTALGFRDPAVMQRIWSIAAQTRATVIGGVPTSLGTMAQVGIGGACLDHLRCLVTGGASLPAEVARQVSARCGRPVYQLYGLTETSGIVAAQRTGGECPRLCVGQPAPMLGLAIGGPSQAARPGASGEVFCSGPNVFPGYLTASGTVDAPVDGWVATGDLGEIEPDGALRLIGRSKDIIIRSGHNIDPLMIEEAALMHPAVAQAAAVAMPDAYAGEVPVLYVVLRPEAAASEDEILAAVAGAVAEPPARPRYVFIIAELPLTPLGKIARFRLRQAAAEFAATRS